jgi:hypothetical protein
MNLFILEGCLEGSLRTGEQWVVLGVFTSWAKGCDTFFEEFDQPALEQFDEVRIRPVLADKLDEANHPGDVLWEYMPCD